jgi:hypothetical protein
MSLPITDVTAEADHRPYLTTAEIITAYEQRAERPG